MELSAEQVNEGLDNWIIAINKELSKVDPLDYDRERMMAKRARDAQKLENLDQVIEKTNTLRERFRYKYEDLKKPS